MSELLSGPGLFLVFLSLVLLAFPSAFLYMAMRERRVFKRLSSRLFG